MTVSTTFQTGAYLTDPTSNAMTVMWLTSAPAFGYVEYGPTESLGLEAHATIDGLKVSHNTVHRIRLEGLKPATRYFYRPVFRPIRDFGPYKVDFADPVAGPIRSFTTVDPSAKQLRFVMYNDLHGNVDLWRALHARVADQRFDFALLNGDIAHSMKAEEQLVDTFLAPCGELLGGTMPFFYARGNHETRGAMARDMKRYLGMPGDRYHYAFSRGPARFIVLDAGEDKEDDHIEYSGMNEFDPYRAMQEKFLAAEIESPAWKNARWRIAPIHIPPYYGRDWHTTTYLRRTWQQLLNAGKTDISFSGHNHVPRLAAADPAVGHHHPMIIGGGCKAGEGTVTTVDIDERNLRVRMLRDDGQIVGELVL
jgi:hypothetical protein